MIAVGSFCQSLFSNPFVPFNSAIEPMQFWETLSDKKEETILNFLLPSVPQSLGEHKEEILRKTRIMRETAKRPSGETQAERNQK